MRRGIVPSIGLLAVLVAVATAHSDAVTGAPNNGAFTVYGSVRYARWHNSSYSGVTERRIVPTQRSSPGAFVPGTGRGLLIQRRVVAPEAVVGRQLAEQPVHPYLIEVFVKGRTPSFGSRGGATIWLDSDVNYYLEPGSPLHLDQNHMIQRAQRLARSLRARGAYTVWGSARETRPTLRVFQPHMILMKPQFKHAPKQKLPNLGPNSDKNPLFASAEVASTED